MTLMKDRDRMSKWLCIATRLELFSFQPTTKRNIQHRRLFFFVLSALQSRLGDYRIEYPNIGMNREEDERAVLCWHGKGGKCQMSPNRVSIFEFNFPSALLLFRSQCATSALHTQKCIGKIGGIDEEALSRGFGSL